MTVATVSLVFSVEEVNPMGAKKTDIDSQQSHFRPSFQLLRKSEFSPVGGCLVQASNRSKIKVYNFCENAVERIQISHTSVYI